MNPTRENTFAEFFAGIGLMRIGLERSGWRIAFANDIDEDKWQMYRDHFGDTGEFVVKNVHKLEATAVPDVGSGQRDSKVFESDCRPPALADYIRWN